MNTVAKILIVVNLVLAGAFLGSAGNFLGQQDHWKAKHKRDTDDWEAKFDQKQAALDLKIGECTTLREQETGLLSQLDKANQHNADMREQSDLLKEAFNQASTQLTQTTAALEKAQDTIQSGRTQIDSLQLERATLAEAKRTALDAKEAAVRNLAEKEIQFENLLTLKQTLEARVEDLQSQLRGAQLTAETAVAKAGGADGVPFDQPAHMGQVLSVDNRANVAIVSLGSEDGVRPGYRYVVSRGSQYVGMLEITDVQAKQSAGRSIPNLQQSAVQRGDRVMSR